jgi:BirA family biotin operon repressor/biotin-[acetyl-CoA-carboxylase] ligase
MSVLLKPDIGVNNVAQITLVAGLAVKQALREVLAESSPYGEPVVPGIKWPNDIVINGKKAAGILTELAAEIDHVKAIAVGIGVNVHTASFPQELAESATSLLFEMGQMSDMDCRSPASPSKVSPNFGVNSLAAAVLNCFEPLYIEFLEQGLTDSMLSRYQENCVTLGQEIRTVRQGKELRGRAVSVNASGELVVLLPTGEKVSLNSGEVSVRGLMGYAE